MAIPGELKTLADQFFTAHAHEYNLAENDGCGLYTEAFVRHAQNIGYPLVGHLKKNPGQTQYNGHANDAFLYREAASSIEPLYQAVDIIARAEAKPPYGPNNQPPGLNFGIDIPRYTDADWLAEPNGEGGENDHLVPWAAYNEQGFQRLKNMLSHDYSRRPQGADFDVSVWAGRYFHNCYMGPEGIPLGEDAALKRVKPELCAELHIPMDNYYG